MEELLEVVVAGGGAKQQWSVHQMTAGREGHPVDTKNKIFKLCKHLLISEYVSICWYDTRTW